MIGYETHCKIRHLHQVEGLGFNQIGALLNIDPETAARHVRLPAYPRRQRSKRAGKLDAFKPLIAGWLERYPYSAAQIFDRLRMEFGYTGGYSILKAHVRAIRPVRHAAYLSLAFAPGECAQVDWGSAGSIQLGQTRRRLCFFVMVLSHSRMAYVEFTCGEATEHFLACHQRALEHFGGVPREILIDNLKTGVLSHPHGQAPVFNPRYLDFAAHHGFQPKACNVRKANEKGRVENFVGYVKKNFLAGLDIPPSLPAINVAARQWLDTVANVRQHRETRRRPVELFASAEKPALQPLPALPADTSVTRLVRVNNRCRVTLDTNRYSVPYRYASQRLTLKAFAERLCLYHEHNLVAEHPRCYERHRDFENPDHVRELKEHKRRARDARGLRLFYDLCPQAEEYLKQMEARSLNARVHVVKIVALAEIYGNDKVARALRDATEFHAYSSQYIEHILLQRERIVPQGGALHLTRREDLLELQLAPANLNLYTNP
jgi:transposase